MLETVANTPGESARAALRDGMAPQDKKSTETARPAVNPDTAAEPPWRSAAEMSSAATAKPDDEAAAQPDTTPADRAKPCGEIELKLLVDADQLADFNTASVIAMHARNRGARKHLKSVYYDTPGRALRRNGLSLRVRQTGARFVQTVKREFADDALRRGE